MYIWLTEKAKKQFKKRDVDWACGKKEFEFLGDVRVETHENSGKKYIDVRCDNPMDLTFIFPDIPQELIEKITLKGRIEVNFRTAGIYHQDDALLLLESRSFIERSSEDLILVTWQDVSASAPTIEKLKNIYSLVRQGKLQPEENWEAKPEKKEQAVEPTDPAKS